MFRVPNPIEREPQGGVGDHPALRAFGRASGRPLLCIALTLLGAGSAARSLAQSAPAGSLIRNTAQVGFQVGSAPRQVTSNEVALRVEPAASKALIAVARWSGRDDDPALPPESRFQSTAGPTQCRSDAGLTTLAAPTVAGAPALDPAQAARFAMTTTVHAGDAVFVRVIDRDQNRDSAVREFVDVRIASLETGDTESLRLAETGLDTGEFVGYVPSRVGGAVTASCQLDLQRDSQLEVSYVDPRDVADSARAQSLVDPYGVVFDSTTGAPVDRVRVRLVEAASGRPAIVFGDDGVSRYPAELITGAAVTDSSGTTYRLPPGTFRFPLVASGSYRLIVEPPAGYLFASSADAADLQRLPGAPFRLSEGSFGRGFVVAAPVVAIVDVPLDPAGDTLTLRKTASAEQAAVGDFVEYEIIVENASRVGALRDLLIEDRLPRGLRLRRGSLRVDGVSAPDPTADLTGRTITIPVASLAARRALRLRYVTEVTAAATGDELVNTARATAAGGVLSNEARVRLRLRNDLFTDLGFIVGRVFAAGCDAPVRGSPPGVEGVRVYLENGRYAVTDRDGRYHFEGVEPGSHVVQLDTDTLPDGLEAVQCGASVRHAGRAFSQFVDLRAGSLWRTDFRLARRAAPAGEVRVSVNASIASAAVVQVDVEVVAEHLPMARASLLLQLPQGFQPANEAFAIDGKLVAPTAPTDGVWTIPLGVIEPGVARKVRALFRATPAALPGAAEIAALLRFAVVSKTVKPGIASQASVAQQALQLTSPVRIALAVERFRERLMSVTLGAQRTVSLVTPTHGDVVPPGSAMLDREPPDARPLAAVARPADPAPPAAAADYADSLTVLDPEAIEPGVRFLAPQEFATPAIASLKVAVAHAPAQRVALFVNGAAVSDLNFDGVTANASRTIAVSRWRGVDLRDGDNELLAVVTDEAGQQPTRLRRIVHYGGGAVRAEFDQARSTLAADGRARPTIVLRLFDAYGKPARAGTRGSFRVAAPYRSWFEVQALDDNPLLGAGSREPTFEVESDGLARLELEPTTLAGNATLELRFNERQSQELRVWLAPAPRDWILVGIASGTTHWNQVSRAAEPLDPADTALDDDGTTTDGRIAFFAKGRIRGDALLTMAYDSTRDPRAARQRLNGVIEPDRYYLLYGDGTESREEAASSERVFVKLERRQFIALFGDYDSGLTVTELSRYSRSLTGLKAEYGGERASFTGFAARTDLGFVRDELRGDGTSGLYRLSRRPLVIGSDKLRVEVRDRFRSERILETRELARFLDYVIDYEAGTVLFKEPQPSRDERFNPLYIVAEYETRGTGAEVTAAGGRLALRSHGDRLEVGTTLLSDGALSGDTQLAGADLKWHIDAATELRAEFAHSRSDDPLRAAQANGYLLELEHVSERLESRVYLRDQEQGFGVDQQLASESGTRKAGVDARWNLDARWALQGELLTQEALLTGAQRRLVAGELRYQRETATASLGLRHVADKVPASAEQLSEQAVLQGSIDLLNRRVTLRGALDASLGGRDQSSDYPSRLVLGADYRLHEAATAFAEWEHFDGAALRGDMTRVGVRARPWERTQIVSAVNQENGEFGPRVYANFGLTQGLRVNDSWTIDAGLDQGRTLSGNNIAGGGAASSRPSTGVAPLLNAQTPLASGDATGDDFVAAFVGAQYHRERWTLTSRAERRVSDLERRWVLSGGWYREPVSGHALSLSLQSFTSDSRSVAPDTSSADLRFAWAWRPDGASWIVLNRTDLVRETRTDLRQDLESSRWVNNTHANWQIGPDQQLGLQLGLRRAVTMFEDQRFSGMTALLGFDWRRDLPWRAFGRSLDVGAHATRLDSIDAGVTRDHAGFDIGITVANNVWVSLGYNFIGFDDDDFSRARETQRGPYLRFRIKADQDTFRDLRLDSLRPPR